MLPTPVIPDWVKLLNQYDASHYVPGKKVTAEEWNALFLAATEQGNYHAETLKLLIDSYLPETYYTKINIDTQLNTKVDKVEGKELSENDYSDAEKAKVTESYSLKHAHFNKAILDTLTSPIGNVYTRNTGTAAGNVPILDINGKLNESTLPAIAITDTYVVNSLAEMLALTAEKGDIAVRTDENKSYSLKNDPASIVENWVLLRTPTDAVLSVDGQTGAVETNAIRYVPQTLTAEQKAIARANLGAGSSSTTDYNELSSRPILNADLTTLSAETANDNMLYRHTGAGAYATGMLYVKDVDRWQQVVSTNGISLNIWEAGD